MSAARRVAAGAALLDERRPGWAADVDPDHRDRLGGVNVLAQLWRGSNQPYVAASGELGTHGRNHELGFVRDPVAGVEYPELNAAWRVEVERRRQAEPEPDCARCPHPPHPADLCEAPAADDDESTCGCEEGA